MDSATRRERVKEFNDLMEKVIVRYQDVLGPQSCVVHSDLADCDETCSPVADGALLRTWVVSFGWEVTTGDDAGMGVPDYFTPEGSMSWEMIGLLQHNLDAIRGID